MVVTHVLGKVLGDVAGSMNGEALASTGIALNAGSD
jgi:hypothetical protein